MEASGQKGTEEPDESLDLEPREQAVEASGDRSQQPAEGVFAAEYKSHSGPLPSPEWFAGLESIHPGATEIILRDFTEEREHQRRMQERAIALDTRVFADFSRYQQSRLWIAGGLALFVAAGGLALIFFDKAIEGFVLLIAEITALVGAFLVRRAGEGDVDDLDDEELDRLLAEVEEEEKD